MATEIPEIPLNQEYRKVFRVESEHSAKHVGSGEVEVLSTPSMILFMEMTALEYAQKYLPPEYTTVGTRVDVRHTNPAPVGAEIEVVAKLVSREGRKLVFEVKALWGDLVIGEGIHERYIVHRERFLEKVRKLIESRTKKERS